MRLDRLGLGKTSARTHGAWFRVASWMLAAELVALGAVIAIPRASSHAPAKTTSLAAKFVGSGVTAPPSSGRRSAPTTTPTTTAPTTTTTAMPVPVAPVVTAPPAPAPAKKTAPPPPEHTAPASSPPHVVLPPANPPVSIPPDPNFLAACSATNYDDSSGCVSTTLAAIAHGRSAEGLPAMGLPSNWGALNPAEQLYVVTNLERTVRGLPPLSSMASALDQAAAQGAGAGNDPSPPAGFPFSQWGANWAGGVGNPLEADYYWMYDDGPGSNNADCTAGNSGGCWGHRDMILLSMACSPCVMGTAVNVHGWNGQPSWAELLVSTSGDPAADFTWQQESASLG
jgi:hypothetical protein